MNKLVSLVAGAGALALVVAGAAPAFAAGEDRLAGADRIETAIKVLDSYSGWGKTAVLARSNDYADALSAAALAGAYSAPVLLTGPGALDGRVSAALVGRGFTNVILVGGEAALSAQVESGVKALGLSVSRVAGGDRYATSLAAATKTAEMYGANLKGVFVARGDNFADALGAGAAAVRNKAALVLVPTSGVGAATVSFLTSKGLPVVAAGGPAANALAGVKGIALQKVVGADRYETAALLNSTYNGKVNGAALASGEDYPDALTVAVPTGKTGKALLLTKAAALPEATRKYLTDNAAALKANPLNVIGGVAAIADAVKTSVQAITGGDLTPANRWIPANGEGTLTGVLSLDKVTQKVHEHPSQAELDALKIKVSYTGSDLSSVYIANPGEQIKLTPTYDRNAGTITFAASGTDLGSVGDKGTWRILAKDAPELTFSVEIVADDYKFSNNPVSVGYVDLIGSGDLPINAYLMNGTFKVDITGSTAFGQNSATAAAENVDPGSAKFVTAAGVDQYKAQLAKAAIGTYEWSGNGSHGVTKFDLSNPAAVQNILTVNVAKPSFGTVTEATGPDADKVYTLHGLSASSVASGSPALNTDLFILDSNGKTKTITSLALATNGPWVATGTGNADTKITFDGATVTAGTVLAVKVSATDYRFYELEAAN